MFRKFLSMLTALSLALGAATVSAFAEESADITGSCGENAVWSFDELTGVLTISGTGDMYTSYTPVDQWGYYPYRNEILEVVIEEGITSIAICAFGLFDPSQREPSKYPNLSKLSLSSSVKSIGDYAFFKSGLTSIEFSEELETIGECAFMFSPLSGELNLPLSLNDIGQSAFSNTDITSVDLHEGMTIGGVAFSNCNSLKEVIIPRNLTYRPTGASNAARANAAFSDCTGLEKVVILGGGLVKINLSADRENGLAQSLFGYCTSLKEIVIESEDISYVDVDTFDMTNNPTFYIYKGSTTEKTLTDAGYLTDANVVYIANKTPLDEAIKSAEEKDLSQYTDESVKVLTEAIESGISVLEDPDVTQDSVDNARKAIEDAISALELKPADYTAVDEAIAKIPEDLSIYTDETVEALNAAFDAVDRTKNITEQETVDGYASAIEEAIAALVKKPTEDPNAPKIGDVSGDGVISTVDVGIINSCARGVRELTPEQFALADVNGDGKVTTVDVGLVNAHAKGVSRLW